MNPPINFKSNIPLYYDKSNSEFRLDPYERYNEMVIRQIALHLADELWGGYPFQKILDFVLENVEMEGKKMLTELGCGVGRLIGELANHFPQIDCLSNVTTNPSVLGQSTRFIFGQNRKRFSNNSK